MASRRYESSLQVLKNRCLFSNPLFCFESSHCSFKHCVSKNCEAVRSSVYSDVSGCLMVILSKLWVVSLSHFFC